MPYLCCLAMRITLLGGTRFICATILEELVDHDHDVALRGPTRLVIGGWVVALVASGPIVVVKLGEPGASEGVVFAMIAVAMGAWIWIRGSGAAMITSLVLGALWTVMFGGYVIASAAADLEP